jgi:hypothetical protein
VIGIGIDEKGSVCALTLLRESITLNSKFNYARDLLYLSIRKNLIIDL